MNETAVSKLAIPPSLFLFRRERLNELWRESTPAFRLGRLTFFLQRTDKEFYLEKSPQFPSFCAVLDAPVKTIFDFPGASTDPLSATGPDTIKARWIKPAGLVFSTRLFAFLFAFRFSRQRKSRDTPPTNFRVRRAQIDRKALNTVTHPK